MIAETRRVFEEGMSSFSVAKVLEFPQCDGEILSRHFNKLVI